MNTADLKSFHYLENGEISFSMLDTIRTKKKLECGVYNLTYLDYPESRLVLKTNVDGETVKMHEFPDKEKLDNLFKAFFDKKVVTKMAKLGFYHKVGIILYGKEGTGKSTIIKNYYDFIMRNHDAIVFYISSSGGNVSKCWEFISKIRAIQKNPIIVIFEEFDSFLGTNQSNVGMLKTMLDGNLSIDNCMVMASTNNIDSIPAALKNRPSRFKYVLNIEGIQSESDIVILLQNMISDLFTENEIKKFAKDLKGNTLDFIKQFAIDKIMDLETYNHNKAKKIGFVE